MLQIELVFLGAVLQLFQRGQHSQLLMQERFQSPQLFFLTATFSLSEQMHPLVQVKSGWLQTLDPAEEVARRASLDQVLVALVVLIQFNKVVGNCFYFFEIDQVVKADLCSRPFGQILAQMATLALLEGVCHLMLD